MKFYYTRLAGPFYRATRLFSSFSKITELEQFNCNYRSMCFHRDQGISPRFSRGAGDFHFVFIPSVEKLERFSSRDTAFAKTNRKGRATFFHTRLRLRENRARTLDGILARPSSTRLMGPTITHYFYLPRSLVNIDDATILSVPVCGYYLPSGRN